MGQQLYDVYRPTFLEFLQAVYKLTDISGEFASVLKNCGRTKKDQSRVAIMLHIGLPQIHRLLFYFQSLRPTKGI